MPYTNINFKSKAAIRRALAEDQEITVYDPGIGLAHIPENGTVSLEGPHYPQPPTWSPHPTPEGDPVGARHRKQPVI